MAPVVAVIFVLFLLPRDLDASESRWCYECGTGVAGQPDCEEFAQASSWMTFWRECPKESICVQILPAWPSERNALDTVRGCTPRASHRGVVHREGCWTHPSAAETITCFCDSDLCNAALAATPLLSLLQSLLAACCVFFFMR